MKKIIVITLLSFYLSSFGMLNTPRYEKIPSRSLRKSFHSALKKVHHDPNAARRGFLHVEQKALREDNRHWAANARIVIGVLRLYKSPFNLVAFEDILTHFLLARKLANDDPEINFLSEKLITYTVAHYESMTKK